MLQESSLSICTTSSVLPVLLSSSIVGSNDGLNGRFIPVVEEKSKMEKMFNANWKKVPLEASNYIHTKPKETLDPPFLSEEG